MATIKGKRARKAQFQKPSQEVEALIFQTTGKVQWYGGKKNFGFIAPDADADNSNKIGEKGVFFHRTHLREYGLSNVLPNARVTFMTRYNEEKNGYEVVEFIEIEEEPAVRGTLKFFDKERGFGFLKREVGGKDIFLHVSTLEACRLEIPEPGAPFMITKIREAEKGPEALELQPAA